MMKFERCPECGGLGVIDVIDDGDGEHAVCSACFAHLRHSLTDGHWKAETYGE
jgi:hypothetical protein